MSIPEQSIASTISSGSNNYNNILHTQTSNNRKNMNKDQFDSDSDTKIPETKKNETE